MTSDGRRPKLIKKEDTNSLKIRRDGWEKMDGEILIELGYVATMPEVSGVLLPDNPRDCLPLSLGKACQTIIATDAGKVVSCPTALSSSGGIAKLLPINMGAQGERLAIGDRIPSRVTYPKMSLQPIAATKMRTT